MRVFPWAFFGGVRTTSPNTRQASGQCGPGIATEGGGKICRGGIKCRGCWAVPGVEKRGFFGVFGMAWGLLIHRRGNLAARCGHCRSSAMLLALGAATAALDAVGALASSGASSAKSSGFSAVDPFEIASPASASTSSAPLSAGSQLSPATLSTLLAAQGQSSTGSNPSTSASDAWQDLSSQIDNDTGSSDSTATSSCYNSLAQMFQQQMNAMSFSAPPLSFSV